MNRKYKIQLLKLYYANSIKHYLPDAIGIGCVLAFIAYFLFYLSSIKREENAFYYKTGIVVKLTLVNGRRVTIYDCTISLPSGHTIRANCYGNYKIGQEVTLIKVTYPSKDVGYEARAINS
jgi:hypothetical protein